MRIAVTYEQEMIFQHFGHTSKFKVYDVEEGEVMGEMVLNTNGQGHGALAGFLMMNKVDIVICGGIGGGARNALSQFGIGVYAGVSGSCDEAVEALLAGELKSSSEATCSHHHGEEHTCGEHGCGEHGCGEHGSGNH